MGRILRLRPLALAFLFMGALGARAAAVDVPIAGQQLKLKANQSNAARRSLTFRSGPNAPIAAPLADPTLGASLLVFASNATGQCRAEIALPAGNWQPLGGDGPNRGWKYTDATGSAGGVRKVIVRPGRNGGRIVVKAKGAGFPCALPNAQSVPIAVALRLDDTRYCAAFGGTIARNETGRVEAENAAAPLACPDNDLTVATLNVLHGIFCPAPSGFCRLTDRLDLLGQWIVARGCPDVVALQEVFDLAPTNSMVPLIQNQLTGVCAFPYQVVFIRTFIFDDSLLLTRYPALSAQTHILHGGLRNVLHARLDHPIGPVDVFSTHLGSSSDGGPSPCSAPSPCPAACVTAGAATVRQCQAVQTAQLVETLHDVAAPAVIVGDFNEEPLSFVYDQLVDRGWTDTYLAAGNPECDDGTGIGCTSGREDEALTDLESPALGVTERIDYVFLVPPGPASLCAAALDSPLDADGDGTATRLFADEPNTFAPACGPLPDPTCWVSDHSGVQVDVNCD